jgi:hypothetical protein
MSARTGLLRLCRQCWDLTAHDNPCRCGQLPPALTVGNASEAIRALADLRDLIWPGGNDTAKKPADVLDAIVLRLAFLKPPPKGRPVLRSVPR